MGSGEAPQGAVAALWQSLSGGRRGWWTFRADWRTLLEKCFVSQWRKDPADPMATWVLRGELDASGCIAYWVLPVVDFNAEISPSRPASDQNPLDLVQADLVAAAVVEPGRARGFVIGHSLRDLQAAAIA